MDPRKDGLVVKGGCRCRQPVTGELVEDFDVTVNDKRDFSLVHDLTRKKGIKFTSGTFRKENHTTDMIRSME